MRDENMPRFSSVAISGVPGTGKTTIAKIVKEKLRLKGYEFNLIPVNDLAKKENLIIGFDEKRNCDIVDVESLRNIDLDALKPCILEGHLSHFLNADIIFVLRCDPIILKERLKKKGWRKKEKILENLEAEITDIVSNEAVAIHSIKNVFEVRTDEFEISEVGEALVKLIAEGKVESKVISKPKSFLWAKYLDLLSKGELEKIL